ncbi:DEAD/DEAH box helicase [Streptomyces sp. HPF1205]|uniref:DEAD/DEAH box helicase n=1 Tax=Streptomyces sp. HPF1205 TaxID=2873262 RepID=UPI001CEDE93C|nr:DEAD/DEAH box helicase [Streptomyces sp. HPF1205]
MQEKDRDPLSVPPHRSPRNRSRAARRPDRAKRPARGTAGPAQTGTNAARAERGGRPEHTARPQHTAGPAGGTKTADPARSGTPATGGGPATDGGAGTARAPIATSFADLGLPAALSAALTDQGVTVPFPIQAATLPSSLAGRDVLGRGRTGSGKTLAFGLALLARTAGQRAQPRRPLALVLVPTRELAQQVTEALTPYARAVRLRLTTVVGGMSIGRQAAALRGGAEVLVATPGRLRDLVDRGDCALDQVRTAVLDEADQMADMGFLPQVTALLAQVPADGQRMLFSATLDRDVDRLVRRFLSDPVVHHVDPPVGAVSTMEHHLLHVTVEDKRAATIRIAAREGRVLLFMDSKRAVDRLAKALLAGGVRAAALHGGKSQPQRNRALDGFRSGEITALVATNVAARGIHIDDLDLVVNVDPPADHKDYLHRGGRTARAGAAGSVVTLVLPEQRRSVNKLMTDAGVTPRRTAVHSADEELARITGARAPSGVPVVVAAPAAPARPGGGNGGKRVNGGGGDRGTRGSGGADGGSGVNGRARGRRRSPRKPPSRPAGAAGAA